MNGNGTVGTDDIVYVVDHYMTLDALADLDEDGVVAVGDIVIVVQAYGSTC
jgi:hypothetical protein